MNTTAAAASSSEVNLSSVIRRCGKLLAMAEDGRGNPAEAAVAASQAKNIMAKFGLSRSQVVAADPALQRQATEDARAAAHRAAKFAQAARDFGAQVYANQKATAERAKAAAAKAQFDAEFAAVVARRAASASAAAKPAATPPAAKSSASGVRSSVSVKQDGSDTRRHFASLRAAFEALSLPMGQHIKFRAQLKAAGRMRFGEFMFTNHAN